MRITIVVAVISIATAAPAALPLVPTVIDVYTLPSGNAAWGGHIDHEGRLVLITSGTEPGFLFDPVSETFTPLAGFLFPSIPGYGAWVPDEEHGLIAADFIYTGFADSCPDGSYAASGWGGGTLRFGNNPTSEYVIDREIRGMTRGPGGEVLLLEGISLNPCDDLPPGMEISILSINDTLDPSDPQAYDPVSLCFLEGSEVDYVPTHRSLHYDAALDVYWAAYESPVDGTTAIHGFDREGRLVYTLTTSTTSELLVPWEGDRYFLVDGTETLRLAEIKGPTAAPSWTLYR